MNQRRNTARREGQRAAQRKHAALEIGLDRPIDIFTVIQDEGVLLMFQPLDKAYGVFLRMGGEDGILVNSKHPLALQRFTAAHEFGHFTLGHSPSLDGKTEIETSDSSVLNEISANAFAAEFLMPLGLVNRSLTQLGLGLRPSSMTPHDVYRLSLLLGTSYEATVYHLVSHKKLTVPAARTLRQTTPKEIKRAGTQRDLVDSWADCWFLDENQAGSRIFPRLGDEVCINLPASPSTGHIWHVAPSRESVDTTQSVEVIHEGFTPDNNDVVGSSGTQDLAIRVGDTIGSQIELRRGRPWEPSSSDARFQVGVEVVGRPLAGRDHGLADRQLLSA